MDAKLFKQIYDSSIADDWEVRVVFEDLIILADSDGVVDMTPESISARTRVPQEIVNRALAKLQDPDPKSRTPDHEGRRIILLDEHRAWGWMIVNYETYRKIHCESDRRDNVLPGRFTKTKKGYVYYLLNGTRNSVKIGFSKNPWARVEELKTADPGIVVVATEKGLFGLEHQRHEQFSSLRKDREWFDFSGKLKEFIQNLRARTVVTVVDVVTTPPSPSSYCTSLGNRGVGKGGNGEVNGHHPEPHTNGDQPVQMDIVDRLRNEVWRIYKKSPGLQVSYTDQQNLVSVSKRPDVFKEVELLSKFKQSQRFFPQTASSLLENWDRTVDRANNPASWKSEISLSDRLKALEKSIESHIANKESCYYNPNCTEEKKAELRRLREKHRNLIGEIAAHA